MNVYDCLPVNIPASINTFVISKEIKEEKGGKEKITAPRGGRDGGRGKGEGGRGRGRGREGEGEGDGEERGGEKDTSMTRFLVGSVM